MATQQECEKALFALADRLAERGAENRATGFDRSLSCSLRDLKVVYAGRLRDGLLGGIRQVPSASAQIRLDLTSDDLVALVDGKLNLASAWAGGRIKVHAGVRDMMKLRTIF